MIILRKGSINKFYYEDASGTKIKNKDQLKYLDNLRIPPAYRDVEIFYVKNPKILFQGYDAASRLQQIYSPEHCKKQCRKKFKALIDFGNTLPKIYADCDRYIANSRTTKNKIIGLIIKIISMCYFRIGNTKYLKLYNSYGISNIKKSHVYVVSGGLKIEFIGKKGVTNTCIFTEKNIVHAIKDLLKNKSANEHIFTYNENGENILISAIEINNWLKSYNSNFTTKFFRTFDANVLLLEFMQQNHSSNNLAPNKISEAKRKKILAEAMRLVSTHINNTAAICRKSYIMPELIELYFKHPLKFKSLFLNKLSPRTSFINFLKLQN